jgi:hypothetical protein
MRSRLRFRKNVSLAVSHKPPMLLTFNTELVLLLLAALIGAATTGCRHDKAAGPLIVVAAGDTAGWIVPCGCTTNQSGGLPRRATYLEGLRGEAKIVLIDVGGAVHGTSPYDRAKLEAILLGETLMGVAAHNLGAAEARFGPAELRRLAEKTGVPFLSANACDKSGQSLTEPIRIVEAAGRRLALVGVLSESFATADVQISSPRQAVLDALRGAAGKFDAVIVLAYLPEDELRQLADALPEADAIVGGPTGQPISPKRVGPVLLTSATHEGKFVARLDAPAPGTSDRWQGSIVELTEQYADDAQQKTNIDRFRAELAEADFSPEQTSFAKDLPADIPKGFAIAGTKSCQKCHEEDCQAWRSSKHAGAWKSLGKKGAHVDPDCQRCHTTGYGQPGGFVSARRSDRLAGVGCESCHGPSLAHVNEPLVHTAYFAQAKNHCTGCHDRENSPKFEYETYWNKIVHGATQPERDGK